MACTVAFQGKARRRNASTHDNHYGPTPLTVGLAARTVRGGLVVNFRTEEQGWPSESPILHRGHRASLGPPALLIVRPPLFHCAADLSKSDSSCDAKTLLPIDRLTPPPKPSIWSVDVRLAYTTTVSDCVGSMAAIACSQLYPSLT